MVQTIVLQLADTERKHLNISPKVAIVRPTGLESDWHRAGLVQNIEDGKVLDRPVAFRDALSYLIDLEDEDTLKTAHRVVEALANAEDVPTLCGLLRDACRAATWRPEDDESAAPRSTDE